MEFLPNFINDRFRVMTAQRCLIFQLFETQKNHVTLDAIVDKDVSIAGTKDALQYLPRALQLGLFYPGLQNLPFLVKSNSVFYFVSIIESILFSVSAAFIFIFAVCHKKIEISFVLVYSISFVAIYGYTTPFLGALYRYRYPWWEILLCLGLAVAINFVKTTNLHKR